MARSRKLPRILSEDEQARFLDAFNVRYWTPERDYTACLAMLDAGLRVSEVCGLQLDHVDLTNRRLTVREGKGAKDRIVPFNGRLSRALGDWLDRRAEQVGADCAYVFPTRAGKQLDPSHLRRTVSRVVERTNLPEPDRISPHTLRHTYATDVLNATGDLEHVRRLLGHADISTTTIYLHLTTDDLAESLDAAGFRGEAEEPEPDTAMQAFAESLSAEQRQALLRALQTA